MAKANKFSEDFSYEQCINFGTPSVDVGYIAISGDWDAGFGEGHVGFSSEFICADKAKQIHVLKDWIEIMKGQLERTKDEFIIELSAKARK